MQCPYDLAGLQSHFANLQFDMGTANGVVDRGEIDSCMQKSSHLQVALSLLRRPKPYNPALPHVLAGMEGLLVVGLAPEWVSVIQAPRQPRTRRKHH